MARQRRSTCIHGHPFTPENVYHIPSTGQRCCVTCRLNRRAVVGAKPPEPKPEGKPFVWTPEADYSLLRRLLAGESYSKIAAALRVSKNACVGRYYRIRSVYDHEKRSIRKAWPLTMCAELPMSNEAYVPIN